MKKLLLFLCFSLLLLGCTSSQGTNPTPTATITPTPTPTPEPVASEVIKQAGEAVPISAGFLSAITDVRQTAPKSYSLVSEGSFSFSLGLAPVLGMEFADVDFAETLKRIATAGKFRKTVKVAPGLFSVKWESLDDRYQPSESVDALLARDGESRICVKDKDGNERCEAPTKAQADELWDALQASALEKWMEALYPGVSIGEFIDVKKDGTTDSFAGRPCNKYSLALTQKGIGELNALGGSALSDLQGELCLDVAYGFPLLVKLSSSVVNAREEVKEFREKGAATATPRPAPTAATTPTPAPVAALEPATRGMALVVGKAGALTEEENAAKALLAPYAEKGIGEVTAEEATFDTLRQYSAIATTDYRAEASDLFTRLAQGGRNVLLLHDAVGYAGTGAPQKLPPERKALKVAKNTAFLRNYDTMLNTAAYAERVVQQGGDAYYGYGQYRTSGWVGLDDAFNEMTDKNTAFAFSDSKSAALGYDPSKLTDEGRIVFREMLRWMFGLNSLIPAEGKVVLVAKDYSDQPKLTQQEEALRALFEGYGKAVKVVSQSKRFEVDYSSAGGVAAAHVPLVGLRGFYTGIAESKPSVFAYDALNLLAPITPSEAYGLVVNRDKAFLAKYDAEYDAGFAVVDGGKTFAMVAEVSGSDTYSPWYRIGGISEIKSSGVARVDFGGPAGAAFYLDSGKARSAMFGYDPSKLTGEGRVAFKEILRWIFGDETPEYIVPEGAVALVISDFDDANKLTADESAAKSIMESMNARVAVVPQKFRFTTDYSRAKYAVVAEFLGARFGKFFTGAGAAMPRAALLGAGLRTIRGPAEFTSLIGARGSFQVLDNQGFFAKISKGTYYDSIKASGRVFGVSSERNMDGSIRGLEKNKWQTVGGSSCISGCYANTAGFTSAEGNRCVALFGTAPSSLNGNGASLLYKVLGWAEDCKAK